MISVYKNIRDIYTLGIGEVLYSMTVRGYTIMIRSNIAQSVSDAVNHSAFAVVWSHLYDQ
jgi:hypothetical protein